VLSSNSSPWQISNLALAAELRVAVSCSKHTLLDGEEVTEFSIVSHRLNKQAVKILQKNVGSFVRFVNELGHRKTDFQKNPGVGQMLGFHTFEKKEFLK
jgi:hypothetical protein